MKKEQKLSKEDILNLRTDKLIELKNTVKTLPDSRTKKKCTYKLWDIICIIVLATLANCNEWDEIHCFATTYKKWLQQFLKLTGGIPSTQTFERVCEIVDSSVLNTICVEFATSCMHQKVNPKHNIVNFDGKVDKGSSRKTGKNGEPLKALNVLNAYSNNLQMCIDQEMIEDKTNEITAMPTILNRLNLKGVICTWDALNTQKEIVKTVIENKGDYVAALKGNQHTFYQEVKEYFDEDRRHLIQSGYEGGYQKSIEKSNSNVVTYEYYQTNKVNWFEEKSLWSNLNTIGFVKKTIENIRTKQKAFEERYYISSLTPDVSLFATAIRSHWSVENKLHWHLDFTFKQDNNTTANKKALFNLQIIKKFSLSILSMVKEDYNCSLKKIRFKICMNAENEFDNIFKILAKKQAYFN